MPSLRDCIGKFGKSLSPSDIAAIYEQVTQTGSELEAVRSYLNELRSRRVEMFGSSLNQAPKLHSVIEKEVQTMNLPEWKKDLPAKGKVIWAKLKKVGNKDEHEFLGLEEWLTENPDEKFTRQDVVEFIQANGIKIEEVMATEDGEVGDSSEIMELDESDGEIDDDPGNWTYRADDLVDDYQPFDEDYTWLFDADKWFDKQTDFDWLEPLGVEGFVGINYERTGPDLSGNYTMTIYQGNEVIWQDQDWDNAYPTPTNKTVFLQTDEDGDVLRLQDLDDLQSEFGEKLNPLLESAYEDELFEVAEKAAKDEYMENPHRTWSALDGKVEIFGNEDIGLTVRVNDRIIDSEIYSFEEAKITANGAAVDAGLLDDADGSYERAKWGDYVADGPHDNYREQKLILPETKSGDTFEYDYHFPDDNIVAFNRLTDRQGRDGKELRIEETQSDWESEARRAGGYATGRPIGEIEAEMATLESQINQLAESIYDPNFIYADTELSPEVREDPQFNQTAIRRVVWRLAEQDAPPPDTHEEVVTKITKDYEPIREEVEMLVRRYNDLIRDLGVERKGIPSQPYKSSAWTELTLKYALATAIEEGYSHLAWNDNATIQERWGSGNDYTAQYDRKMPSMIKKLTGQRPRHVTLDDEPFVDLVDPSAPKPIGKWVIDITPDMSTDFTLRQDQNRGEIQLLDNERVIKLGQASDLSTFLHEAGHLFLEMEKQLADEFDLTDNQQAILDWLGAQSFDEITATTPEGVKMHEQFARGFEAYLMEGKAPSLKLRDAFAAFKAWLVRIYQNITNLDVELSPAIREVFDRLLATEAEILEASANPVYDQFFKSKEQAGMTDEEWEAYQKRTQKRQDRAKETVADKVIKEYRARAEAEWNEEKAPLIEEEYERLAALPPYQLLNDLAQYPMDYDLVMAALPNQTKLPGRLIGKARKEDGVDPQEYAEVYGYGSVAEMLDEIINIPTLKQASEQAAERRMVERHGDILNDGTLEIEAQEALHNDEQAELLLTELRALKPTRANAINRDYLKAEAARVIASMTYSEIKPDKYYRAEIRAAKRAVTGDNPYEAKVQQLVNHYLYREAMETRRKMERHRRYVKSVQRRKYDPKVVDEEFIANLKAISHVYDMGNDPEQQRARLTSILTWFNDAVQREDIDLVMMDPNLELARAARDVGALRDFKLPSFDELTASDMRGLYDMLRHLRFLGGQLADYQNNEIAAERNELIQSIIANGGDSVGDSETVGRKPGPLANLQEFDIRKLLSLKNLVRNLDGFEPDGAANRLIFMRVQEADNRKIELTNEMHDRFRDELDGIHKIGLSSVGMSTAYKRKRGIPVANEVTMTKSDGTKWSMNPEEMFMLALYWGTETSREAIREGHGVNDADVMAMLQNLTEDQLKVANAVWHMNESMWPQLSAASIKRYGVSPEKLDPTPYTINGVQMSGGHMRLFYNSLELDLKQEQQLASEQASIVPSKAGSLHERVGSGGRPVLLDRNNIVRNLEEVVHFIAYAETGAHIRRIVNAREVGAAIDDKHGKNFRRALIGQLDNLIRSQPHVEHYKGLAASFRLLRRAATYRHLVFSIRNVVQQFSSLPIAASEVGTGELAKMMSTFAFDGGQSRDLVLELSPFMRNRTAFVNREATEYLNKIAIGGSMQGTWETIQQWGFAPQTYIDSLIAFPVWMAKYQQGMEVHGDQALAVSDADIAVAESVGSGSDLHLGSAFNSNNSEFVRTVTLFGSWFNAYYNRVYRETKGGTAVMTREGLSAVITLPIVVATMSSLLVMDYPDDDSDEAWWEWVATRYGIFIAGTLPVVRDAVSFMHSGFTPKTVLAGAQEGPGRLYGEGKAFFAGRQSGLKTVSDTAKVVTTVVPVPGSGEITRIMDFIDSYNQGNEGRDLTPLKAYQALVEGPDRNK